MPLQIRRGTRSQRLSITPLVGELVYDTTDNLVYVGNGTTAGGIAIDQDSSPDFPLGDLSDINLEDVAEGDILRYDGDNWINAALSLNSLDSVIVTTPANNDILKFNGTNFVNSELSFFSLPGVELNNPEINQVLKYNGTAWSNENEDSSLVVLTVEDLADVVITDPLVVDQILKYNGTNWVNSLFAEAVADSFDNGIVSYLFDQNTDTVTTSLDLELYNDSANFSTVALTSLNISTTQASYIDVFRSRGTVGTPTSVAVGDLLGGARFTGYNGFTNLLGSEIRSIVDSPGSLGTGMPTSLEFAVNNTNNVVNTLFRISGEEERIQCINSTLYVNYNGYIGDQSVAQLAILQHHDNADANNFSFIRGRGTNIAPTPIQPGDDVIDIVFLGYNGSVYANCASISALCVGTPTFSGVPTQLIFRTNSGTASGNRLIIEPTGEVVVSVALLNNGTGGIGYSAGAGGTQTQTTNKSTTVVLNKITGEITLHDEALAGGSAVTFTLTNSTVAANDHIIVTHISAGSLGAYNLTAIASAGAATVTLRNLTTGPLIEAIVIKYSVIKSTVS